MVHPLCLTPQLIPSPTMTVYMGWVLPPAMIARLALRGQAEALERIFGRDRHRPPETHLSQHRPLTGPPFLPIRNDQAARRSAAQFGVGLPTHSQTGHAGRTFLRPFAFGRTYVTVVKRVLRFRKWTARRISMLRWS